MTAFSAERVLSGLKDFQRDTVEHAFHRLFDAPDSTRRFLVADEVGLGKTIVAKGIAAKTIERLRNDGVKRIDVVYICSNGDIARQNIRNLDVMRTGAAMARRLTLLATEIAELEQNEVNLVALTPGTSFAQRSAIGIVDERVLLHAMLEEAWSLPGTAPAKNIFQGGVVHPETFRAHIRNFNRSSISDGIAAAFAAAMRERDEKREVAGETTLRKRYEELTEDFHRSRKKIPWEQRRARDSFISELRGLLAAACVESLEPDLVILDEFQRFKHLLEDDDSTAASLARSLFNWHNEDTDERARLLLLSATPYRALTVAGDGGDDDHYEDFIATVRFLFNDDAQPCGELRTLLGRYKQELYGADPTRSQTLDDLRKEIEGLLGKVIARTERIGATAERDAMLESKLRVTRPTASDVRQYLMAQDVAAELGQPDVTELWKSAPYLVNFLDGYQLRNRFDAALEDGDRRKTLARLLSPHRSQLLAAESITAYGEVESGTPRLRELAQDVIDSGAWRLLWVPPSMPYHRLGGDYAGLSNFTKRLVFSAWRAVPRAVAGLLSYDAERRMVTEASPTAENTTARRSSQRNRLQFTVTDGRPTGMPALTLIYPSPTLASLADPIDFARANPDGSVDALIKWARQRVAAALAELPQGESTDRGGIQRWYWAAPLLLDAHAGHDSWETPALDERRTGEDSRVDAGWREHIARARETVGGRLDPPLGPRPDDLDDVLARLALGGLGTLALRAIARVTGLAVTDINARTAAGHIAWGLRGLFNSPEATALMRASRADGFWRDVLRHAIEGDLQAVLDEHAHLLVESEGLATDPPEKVAAGVADAMDRALRVRAARVSYSSVDVGKTTVRTKAKNLHTAFATRFGDDEGGSSDADDRPARPSQLREAFNSPYWPFVLVSTSVGQEGLDFHPYCHVVVHWNLPTNPVDLEQREGRVHRFKGHAVRKNVAAKHRQGALAAGQDPWAVGFELAAQERLEADSELVPYWVYPGPSKVERHVLALPLSRELDRFESLRDALTVYRLAFGQARQEDLIEHLLGRLGPERAAELTDRARIDLRPRRLANR